MKRLTGTQSLFQFNSNSNESTQLAQLLCGAQSEKNKGNKKKMFYLHLPTLQMGGFASTLNRKNDTVWG